MQTVLKCLRTAWLLTMMVLFMCPASEAAGEKKRKPPLSIAEQGNFFVGGTYNTDGQITGQMFVEFQIPRSRKHKYPLVFVHGGAQMGQAWWQTPDGREGWAPYFLRRGYAVYVADQAARGRSPYHSAYGPLADPPNALRAQQMFTAHELYNFWPAARLHTRWVGKGVKGDPVFEQFLRSQAAGLTNGLVQETLTADGLVALLDKIGPSILIPHSQPGAPAWLVADRRPNLVKALVQLEPGGPPVARDGPPGFQAEATFAWGLTSNPITYSPPASDPSQLRFAALPKEPEVATCWLQADPPRRLPNLQKVPILLLTSPSGYNSWWDPCTSKFLTQARVDHTWLKLQDSGIQGNGHFMFIEENSDEVAAVVLKWIEENLRTEKQ
ncbi:MAG: alpha/beta hydrolase [Bryobacteraceae bacterium]